VRQRRAKVRQETKPERNPLRFWNRSRTRDNPDRDTTPACYYFTDMPPAKAPLLAIAAPVKTEAPYLVEWIAYHRIQGVRAFLLADNGGADDTSKLLTKLHDAGFILRFDWREQERFQMAFYRQALDVARRLFADGLFLVDVDEFLRPGLVHATTVLDIAQLWLADASIGAVALNWAIYGSSGRTEPGEGLVIERFTRRGPEDLAVNHHAKAFVRVAACDGPADNPHAMALRAGRYVHPQGKDVVWDTSKGFATGITTRVTWDVMRVDHFIVKSRQEFAAKRARGAMLHQERNWDRYFAAYDRNDVEDPVSPEFVARTKEEIAKILARVA
jgi:Glycosyl transferase family 2